MLHALQRIDREERQEAEREERVRVNGPPLLALGVDATDSVDHALDREEHSVARYAAVTIAVHLRHVAAERWCSDEQRHHDREELHPTRGGHQNFSGKRRALTRYPVKR